MNTKHIFRITTVSLAAISLCLLGAWIFIAYKSHSFKSEVALIESEALNRSAESSYLLSVKNTLRDSKNDIEAIDSRFIDKDAIPDFIDMLEKKTVEANVKADFGSINAEGTILSLRMTGSGTWKDIIRFVSTLDSLPYASSITNLGLQKSDASTKDVWSFTLALTQHITSSAQ